MTRTKKWGKMLVLGQVLWGIKAGDKAQERVSSGDFFLNFLNVYSGRMSFGIFCTVPGTVQTIFIVTP
jgi:hypothetical protein